MKKFLKGLEINNVTDDISNDIKHLNIKNYIKFYLFYGVVFVVSVGAILGTREFISSDDFRKALISNGVAPLNTFFYSDYSSESKELEELKKKKEKELEELRNSQSKTFNTYSYKYDDFIADLKAGKIKVNLDETIKEMEAFKIYLSHYFIAYIMQNKDKSITINDNKYTYFELAKKVQSMGEKEALTQLTIPAKIILDDLKLDKENTLNVEIMSMVLHNIYNVTDIDFFSSLKLKDFSIKNGIQLIKENILNGKDILELTIYDENLKENRSYSFRISKLEKEYKAQVEIEKADQENKYKEYLDNKPKIDKRIAKLNQDINNIQKAMQQIRGIRSNVKDYDNYVENIDKILDEVEGY